MTLLVPWKGRNWNLFVASSIRMKIRKLRRTVMSTSYIVPIGANVDLKNIENTPGAIKIMDGQILANGTKKDEGKPRWELLPFDAVEGAVCILTSGAVKYAPRNWEKGLAYGRVYGAIMRHLWKWWMAKVVGETGLDDESGKSHLDHALCELLFLCAYEKRGMTHLDDRPTK